MLFYERDVIKKLFEPTWDFDLEPNYKDILLTKKYNR